MTAPDTKVPGAPALPPDGAGAASAGRGPRPDGAAAVRAAITSVERGNDASRWPDKLPVADRLAVLLDPGSWREDGLLANATADALPADGVRTGVGRIGGRAVAVIAHDFAVKAGSWGRLTCEKQVRILERADQDLLPVIYLVDSAGGRLTDQLGFFSDRRGASRIFQLQIALSGRVPQICCLLGPSAAGGAYMPAFTDWVGMVEGNASMYLASPRVAEKVTGERTTLEEMGGAIMHATVSGCADEVFGSDWEAITAARLLLSYLPDSWRQAAARLSSGRPRAARLVGCHPAHRDRGLRRRRGHRRAGRRRVVLRDQAALGGGDRGRARPAGWPGRRHRGQPAAGPQRRHLRRLRRQGGPVHHDVRRIQRAADLPARRARVHGGRRLSSGRASSATGQR